MIRAHLSALLLALAALAAGAAPAGAADLAVRVLGLRSGEGVVQIALYDDSRRFPEDGGQLADVAIPARELEGGAPIEAFADLPPGRYAVVAFHDENANREMDTNFIGLPLEGYGFSNDATVFLSAPAFEEAAFELGERGATVALDIAY